MTPNARTSLAREAPAVVDALTGVLQSEDMGAEMVFGSGTVADLVSEMLPPEQVVGRVEDMPARCPVAESRKRKAEAEEEEVERQKPAKRVRRKEMQKFVGKGGFRYYVPPASTPSSPREVEGLSLSTMRPYMTPSPGPTSGATAPYTEHRPNPLLLVPTPRYPGSTNMLQRRISPMVPQMAYPTPSPTVSAFSASPTSPAWMPHAPIPEPEPTYVNFAADTQMYNGSAWTQDGYQGQPISCPHPVPTNAGNPPSAEWPMSSSWQEEQLVPGNQYDHDIAAVAMQSAYLCPTPASYPVPLPPSPVSPLAFLTPISSSPPSTAYAAVPPSVEYDVNFAWEQQTAPGNGYGTTTGYQSLDIPEISMDSDLGPSTLFKPVLPHGTFPMVDEPDSSLQYLLDELAPQQDTEMDSWISTISSGAQGTWDHDWV